MAHKIEGIDIPVFDGDGSSDDGLGGLVGEEVRLTLEIGGTKYGYRYFLRAGFPEVLEHEEEMIALHALKLAQDAGGTFVRHFREDQTGDGDDSAP